MPSRTSCPIWSRSRPRARSHSRSRGSATVATTCCCASTASIHNIGPGPLEIRGSQPVNGAMTVTGQRIYRTDSSFRDDNSRHPPDPLRERGWAQALAPEGGRALLALGRGGQRTGGAGVQGGLLPAGQRAGRQLRPGAARVHQERHPVLPGGTAERGAGVRGNIARGGSTSTPPTCRSSGWTSRTSRPAATGSARTSTQTTSCSRRTRPTTAPRWPPPSSRCPGMSRRP